MFTRNFQDYLIVTLMTALIWVYAEARNVQTYAPNEPVPLTLRMSAKDLVIVDQKTTKVSVAFKGAQAELDKLRRSLGNGFQVELDLTEPGAKSIPLADLLRESKPLNSLSVNVVRMEPQTLELTVDRIVRTQVPVSFKPKDVQLVPGSVRIDPPSMPLTAPQNKLAQLGQDPTTWSLEAQPNVDIRGLPPGVEHTVLAQVALPTVLGSDPQTTLGARQVRVTFTIDKKENSYVLPTVPVWVSAPPGDMAMYNVKLHDESRVLKDVKLTGPDEVMAKIEDKSLRVVAALRLSTDDLVAAAGKGELTGQAHLVLPALVTAELSAAPVRYSVTKVAEPMP
jgi:hypothetical protein